MAASKRSVRALAWVMYRGMSGEEYAALLTSGDVKSRGDYNFDNQAGLACRTTEASMVQSYANSFAPMPSKPTLGHPCYVLAAPLARGADVRHVPGTGEQEIGVARAIADSEILGVWRGQVFGHTAEEYELSPVDHYDHIDRAMGVDDTHRARYGGYSALVVWERIR